MRPFRILATCGVLLLLPLAACDAKPMAASPSKTPTPSRGPASPVMRKPALGIGEPRIPQPFTIEQRLLDAVSRGDRQTIERALEHGASISAKDDLKRSTVLLAVLPVLLGIPFEPRGRHDANVPR